MENALQVIEKARAKGALVFAPQNLDCPPLYKVESAELRITPEDCHDVGKGKCQPKREVVDAIGERAGVSFVAEHTGVREVVRDDALYGKRTVYIGYAQGKTRLPDGTFRTSSVCEYEIDPPARAEEDYLSRPDNYKSEIAKRKRLIEWMKTGRQRASTGSRLRVIRELTGMPVAFTAEQLKKSMVFSRVVMNTDYVLGTPEGKMMAIAMATGAAQSLYGKSLPAQQEEPKGFGSEGPREEPRDVTPQMDEESDPFGGEAEEAIPMDERSEVCLTLEEYLTSPMILDTAKDLIRKALNDKEWPLEGDGGSKDYSLKGLLTKCKVKAGAA